MIRWRTLTMTPYNLPAVGFKVELAFERLR